MKRLFLFWLAFAFVSAYSADDMLHGRRLAPSISTSAPATVFFEGASHDFRAPRVLPNLRYSLLDWRGNTLLEGGWPEDGNSPLVLPPQKPGYYVIRTDNDSELKLRDYSFTVIVKPKRRLDDSFFAVDAALSWVAAPGHFHCPWYNGDTYRLVADLANWAGFHFIRERMFWSETQPKANVPPSFGKYLENATLCRERGLAVSGMFHDAAPWADKIQRLPRNLAALYDYCKCCSETFGERMGDWEFWNEQDLSLFSPEAAWDYAAALKAAYLGFKAGRENVPVTFGAICIGPTSPYVYTMFENDAAKFSDFANFHTYFPIAGYTSLFSKIHKMLSDVGRPDWEVWLTECGTNLEGNSRAASIVDGFKAHSPEQELLIAEFYPKAQIALMMNGLARNYYYMFGAETVANGAKDWGIIRPDGSVKPSYATFSTMTSRLGTALIAGEMNICDGVKAYLFNQPDGSQTIVYWALSNVDTSHGSGLTIDSDNGMDFSLRLPDGRYPAADMVGTPSVIDVKGNEARLHATRFPSYICGLKGFEADIKPYPRGRRIIYKPTDEEDLRIILRADADKEDFKVINRKSTAEMLKKSGRLRIQVWNLDAVAKNGHIDVEGGTLDGAPSEINLPPMGKAEFDAVYTPSFNGRTFESRLSMTGVFNGRRSSRFTMPVSLTGHLLANYRYVPLDSLLKTENWRRRDTADSFAATFDEAGKALRFNAVWNGSAKELLLSPEIQLTENALVNAYAIEFEVKSVQDRVENDFDSCAIVLGAERIEFAQPLTTWEPRRILLDDVKGKAAATRLSIEARPVGHRLSLWIRNPRILVPVDK